MFNWQELEELKKSSMDLADDAMREDQGNYLLQVIVYQNEQMLRELKSMGWKLHKMSEVSSKPNTPNLTVGDVWNTSGVTNVQP